MAFHQALLARSALKRLGDLDQLSPGQIARHVDQEGGRRDPEVWNGAWIDHDFCQKYKLPTRPMRRSRARN